MMSAQIVRTTKLNQMPFLCFLDSKSMPFYRIKQTFLLEMFQTFALRCSTTPHLVLPVPLTSLHNKSSLRSSCSSYCGAQQVLTSLFLPLLLHCPLSPHFSFPAPITALHNNFSPRFSASSHMRTPLIRTAILRMLSRNLPHCVDHRVPAQWSFSDLPRCNALYPTRCAMNQVLLMFPIFAPHCIEMFHISAPDIYPGIISEDCLRTFCQCRNLQLNMLIIK